MSNSVPYILILIFLVLILLVLLIGIYNYNFLDNFFRIINYKPVNSYEKFVLNEKKQMVNSFQKDLSSDINKSKEENNNLIEKEIISINQTINQNEIKNFSYVKDITSDIMKKNIFTNTDGKKMYGKGSNVGDFDFHSYGEFVSDEEKEYRSSLIKNLKIKTIVINSITKGNGISQEYYKIAYQTKMIPAKILEVLVESKEFREVIPSKYRSKEFYTNGFKKDELVKFKNTDIIRLLNDWCIGRLTPVSKAWEVKAEK